MNRKIKKIILVCIVLIMGLSGCGGSSDSIEFKVIEDAFSPADLVFGFSILDELEEELVRTESELHQLVDDYDLILDMVRYNEEFFTHSAIILIYFIGGVGNMDANINAVRVQDGLLEIHRTRYIPRGWHASVTRHVFTIIEVSQIDIIGVTEVQIVVIERNERRFGCTG